jgi:hypothetical protein
MVFMPSSLFLAFRALPAPCTDFYIPCNVSYHNVATLGPVPKVSMEKAFAEEQLLQACQCGCNRLQFILFIR